MTIYELKVDVEKLLKEKQGQIDKLKSQLEKQQFERNEALDDLACANEEIERLNARLEPIERTGYGVTLKRRKEKVSKLRLVLAIIFFLIALLLPFVFLPWFLMYVLLATYYGMFNFFLSSMYILIFCALEITLYILGDWIGGVDF